MRKLIDAALAAYQLLLRPLMPRACRFAPSCSDYARAAVASHGAARGLTLTIKRLLKCHPLHAGGWDPVP